MCGVGSTLGGYYEKIVMSGIGKGVFIVWTELGGTKENRGVFGFDRGRKPNALITIEAENQRRG